VDRFITHHLSTSASLALALACIAIFWTWGVTVNSQQLMIASDAFAGLTMPADPGPRPPLRHVAPAATHVDEPPDIPEESEAKVALDRALSLADQGHHQEALEQLGVARELLPRLADRLDMIEGDILSAMGPSGAACEAYHRATESPLRSLAARARIAETRCLLVQGDRRAESSLRDLRRSYPRFPQQLELELLRAGARQQQGDLSTAIKIYRDIDLRHPGSGEATEARMRLEALEARGVPVRPLSPTQRLTRVERLARTGPTELAYQELADLRTLRLTRTTRAKIELIEAGMARREGRYDDARELLETSLALSPNPDAREMLQGLQARPAPRAEADPTAGIRRQLNGISRGRQLFRLSHFQLLLYAQVAASAELADEVNAALEVMRQRRDLPSQIRLRVAIATLGVADDEKLSELLAPARDNPAVSVAATYYHARSLERLGRYEEALRELQDVARRDSGQERFYAFWAGQRVRAMAQAGHAPSDELARVEPLGPPRAPEPDVPCNEIADRLRPLAEAHGAAYPWLNRAVDLLEIDRRGDAAEELHEMYLAWANSRSTRQIRSGVLSVYRGTYVPPHRTDPRTRRERRALTRPELLELADICTAVGEHGLAVRFSGWERANERPRAYEAEVRAAAERHGVDPNLLLAVMRVESVYNPRIISYAGAIGLMQIMPRTGGFIANRLDRDGFTVDQLLEPEVNIDFAAWYLASLLDRFDGRVPLAVASYNGGPHNVRHWMRDRPNMSLDAFCETIPFGQTHRYVRRVLTHYEAYRNQSGEHVPLQDLTLPELTADRLAF
jgi:soluble lytic murein transglycosylase